MQLVQESFSQIRPIRDAFGETLDECLFALDSRFKAMFSPDKTKQIEKISSTLLVMTTAAPDLKQVADMIEELGDLHRQKGVVLKDFDLFADALREALRINLPDSFSDAHETAWRNFTKIIGERMLGSPTT